MIVLLSDLHIVYHDKLMSLHIYSEPTFPLCILVLIIYQYFNKKPTF